ncbi:O-methyltransferase [Streptoalloteichus hindustanus]|uniref:Caffeoyl-CoA O-methyltransferase n=1 Tax=Streptoalloteichus hindustanus TaxID=2017 RepID=A0A1M4WB26_STRHI|nr:O-methyltransferase [Streptoalloteichus hindustanus]SHE78360.1 caffeoyl-CoA O-methyltransferase [Streptoalloteichus hindustanus]
MSKFSPGISPELHEYLRAHSTQPDALLRDLAEETARRLPERFEMQIAPEQGTFLTLLTRLLDVRFAVEVGTFTGYSSICIARGLAPGGRLLCCDVSEEFTDVARRFWSKDGLDDRVELRLAPAVETLRALPAEPAIDLSFIDADKTGYVAYWEEIVPRTRQGGVILVDNVFSAGRVLQAEPEDEVVRAIQEFNEHALADSRVELVVLPIADGLTVARKL